MMSRNYSNGRACQCGKAIYNKSATGRCRPCNLALMNSDATMRARKSKGVRRKFATDPVYAAKVKRRAVENRRKGLAKPEVRAALVTQAVINFKAAHTPEAEALRLERLRTAWPRNNPWCPPHLVETYRYLRNVKKLLAAECKAIILATLKAERERLSPFERQMLDLEAKVKNGTQDIGIHDGVSETAFHLKCVGRAG